MPIRLSLVDRVARDGHVLFALFLDQLADFINTHGEDLTLSSRHPAWVFADSPHES